MVRLLVSVLITLASHLSVSADGRVVEARSPSGRFRVRSVQAEKSDSGRELFDYTLLNTESDQVCWRRVQQISENDAEQEQDPWMMFVDDDGLVIVRTRGDHLFALEAATGNKLGQLDLNSEFSEVERKTYFLEAIPHDIWSSCSRWYFLSNIGDGRLFMIRTYWGKRLAFRTSPLSSVSLKLSTETLQAAQIIEHAWAHSVLEDLSRKVVQSKFIRSEWIPDLRAALLLVGIDHVDSELNLLRIIEQCSSPQSVSPSVSGPTRRIDIVRTTCQTAMRRLGVSPEERTGIEFSTPNGVKLDTFVPLHSRHAKAGSLDVGMSLEEVLQTLGTPDFIPSVFESEYYMEYDIDDESPYSLHLSFEKEFTRLTAIEKRDIPGWRTVSTRDILGLLAPR